MQYTVKHWYSIFILQKKPKLTNISTSMNIFDSLPVGLADLLLKLIQYALPYFLPFTDVANVLDACINMENNWVQLG